METLHPLLAYLATSSRQETSIHRWMGRFQGSSRVIGWRDMRRLGVKNELMNLLKYETENQEHDAFFHVLNIEEEIYREVVMEFMMTYELQETLKITDKRKISFKYLGLYTRSQVQSDWFMNSTQTISSIPNRNHKEIWKDLAGTNFRSSVKSSTFIKPIHHILHKLLCCSILGKRENGPVNAEELKFMEEIIGKRNLNVAFNIAERLRKEKVL